MLDDVHRRHGEACAVDHAADVAVEVDIGERGVLGLELCGVLLGLIAKFFDVGVTVERVVVEVHLAIERDDLVITGDDEGVDLGERAVGLDKAGVERLEDLGRGADCLALEAEREGELAALVVGEAERWLDGDGVDELGGLVCDLLDLDAALGGCHHGDLAGGAVDDHAEVELTRDVDAFLDVEAADLLPLGAGLVSDELHAKDLACDLADFIEALGELDAAALAATTSVDLCLDDEDIAAKLLRCFHRLVDSVSDVPARDGDVVVAKDFLRLMLVNVHAESLLREMREVGREDRV